MFDLGGKCALITGASGGIGSAIAKALYASGAKIAISGTRESKLNILKEELGERATSLLVNLADLQAAADLPAKAEEAMGRLDIVVNAAGITRDNLLMRMSDAEWEEVMNINLNSVFHICRASIRGMLKQRWGRIVNITSVVGSTGNPGQSNYAASKAALVGFSKSLAMEIASRGITVNCIAPGFIQTAMTDNLTEVQKKAIISNVPMKRMGNPEDISCAAVYLSSEESAYMTGQTLHVNGGLAML